MLGPVNIHMKNTMDPAEKELLAYMQEHGEVITCKIPNELLDEFTNGTVEKAKYKLKKRGYVDERPWLKSPKSKVWELTDEGEEVEIQSTTQN